MAKLEFIAKRGDDAKHARAGARKIGNTIGNIATGTGDEIPDLVWQGIDQIQNIDAQFLAFHCCGNTPAEFSLEKACIRRHVGFHQ